MLMRSVASIVATPEACSSAAKARRAAQWLFALSAVGALILATGPARASTLGFSGNFQLAIGDSDPVLIPGSGTATVNASGGGADILSMTLPGGAFAGTASVVFDEGAPISGVFLAGGTTVVRVIHTTFTFTAQVIGPTTSLTNGPGTFDATPELGGIMPINGVAIVCLFSPILGCAGAPSANLVVPLTPLGQGGTVTAAGVVNITAMGAPWFTGVVSAQSSLTQPPTVTAQGFKHGPASNTNTAGQPGGVLQLVTPVQVSTSIGAAAQVAVFGFLTVTFAPEPGQFALAASAAVGLALVALSKRGRKRG